VQEALLEVHLIPSEGDQLADPEAMAVRHEDARGIAVAVAAEAPGGGYERRHFGRGQVLSRAAFAVRHSARRHDFPVFSP
jgi:hypothetical protein